MCLAPLWCAFAVVVCYLVCAARTNLLQLLALPKRLRPPDSLHHALVGFRGADCVQNHPTLSVLASFRRMRTLLHTSVGEGALTGGRWSINEVRRTVSGCCTGQLSSVPQPSWSCAHFGSGSLSCAPRWILTRLLRWSKSPTSASTGWVPRLARYDSGASTDSYQPNSHLLKSS